MIGNIFCCYLMDSWECVCLCHWTSVLHEIISRFCCLSPPSCFPCLRIYISLLLSSTTALHRLVWEYFSSWNCIKFVCLFCPFSFPPFYSSSPIVQHEMRHLPFTLHHSLDTTLGVYSQSVCQIYYTTTIFISDFQKKASVNSDVSHIKAKFSFLPPPITQSHPN